MIQSIHNVNMAHLLPSDASNSWPDLSLSRWSWIMLSVQEFGPCDPCALWSAPPYSGGRTQQLLAEWIQAFGRGKNQDNCSIMFHIIASHRPSDVDAWVWWPSWVEALAESLRCRWPAVRLPAFWESAWLSAWPAALFAFALSPVDFTPRLSSDLDLRRLWHQQHAPLNLLIVVKQASTLFNIIQSLDLASYEISAEIWCCPHTGEQGPNFPHRSEGNERHNKSMFYEKQG